MTFHQDIAAVQTAMAGCGATGEAGDAFAQPLSGLRESRRMFDTLAARFDTHIGPSVIDLPMGDTARGTAHGATTGLTKEIARIVGLNARRRDG